VPRTKKRHPIPRLAVITVLIVALFVAMAGAIVAATLGEVPGAQTALEWVRQEIEELRQLGFTDGDEKLEVLKQEEQAMLRAIENPEGQVDDLDLENDDIKALEGPSWEVGEVVCEPHRGLTADIDFTGARCVVVPRSDQEALYVYLTPRGEALAVKTDLESGKTAEVVDIPVLPDLASAKLSVDESGAIHVEMDGRRETIPTTDW
jgi:hypothetical protein